VPFKNKKNLGNTVYGIHTYHGKKKYFGGGKFCPPPKGIFIPIRFYYDGRIKYIKKNSKLQVEFSNILNLWITIMYTERNYWWIDTTAYRLMGSSWQK